MLHELVFQFIVEWRTRRYRVTVLTSWHSDDGSGGSNDASRDSRGDEVISTVTRLASGLRYAPRLAVVMRSVPSRGSVGSTIRTTSRSGMKSVPSRGSVGSSIRRLPSVSLSTLTAWIHSANMLSVSIQFPHPHHVERHRHASRLPNLLSYLRYVATRRQTRFDRSVSQSLSLTIHSPKRKMASLQPTAT
jgi:hypothetical protein